MKQSAILSFSSVVAVALGFVGACAESEAPRTPGEDGGSGNVAGGRFTAGFGGLASSGGASSAGRGGTAGGAAPAPVEAGAGGEGGSQGVEEPSACAAAEGGASGAEAFPVTLKANTDAPRQFLQAEATITNDSGAEVALSELELRYYFETEYTRAETGTLEVAVFYADVSGGRLYRNITALASGAVVQPAPGVPSADAYITVSFDVAAGPLQPGEQVLAQFQLRPPAGHDDFYQVQDQTNDYSYGACSLRAAPWDRLVLLHASEIVSGTAPAGISGDAGAGGEGGAGVGEGGAGGVAGAGGSGGVP